jgi:hypothetical protein
MSTVSILDAATGQVAAAGSTRLPRDNSTPVLLPDGAVLLLGGMLPEFTSVFKEPEVFTPTTGPSQALPGLAEPLDRQAASLARHRRRSRGDR